MLFLLSCPALAYDFAGGTGEPKVGETRSIGHHPAEGIDAVKHQSARLREGDQLGQMALEPVVPGARVLEL